MILKLSGIDSYIFVFKPMAC